jgi:hypothetical protein
MARWPWLLTREEPAKDKRIECTSALCGICDTETTNGFDSKILAMGTRLCAMGA